jgi:N-acetylglucosaminyldiphosphoundecaprenol N-acetyl-beta-D-mannosaminyltransferase
MDAVNFGDALSRVTSLIENERGGSVFTPNVDHIVIAERDTKFREAYRSASLCLVDGTPVLWAARLLGTPLPEKISGSDFVLPLARVAGERGWRVYLLGGAPGVAAAAAERLRNLCGTDVVGYDDAAISLHGSSDEAEVLERIRTARPHLIFVALGAPKQEFWIQRVRNEIHPAVAVAVGASLDFVAGRDTRAPRWMSNIGLEWLHRLAHNPRRLWRRYLLQDPLFVRIVLRTFLEPRVARTEPASEFSE